MSDTKKSINIEAITAKILKLRICFLCRFRNRLLGKAYCQDCINTRLICDNICDGEYHEFKKSHKDSLCEICLEKPLVENSSSDDDDNNLSDDDDTTSTNGNANANDVDLDDNDDDDDNSSNDNDDDNDDDNNSVYSSDEFDSDREPYSF